ncbi:hypothetical protein ACQ4M4_25865 [Leptolyngbya sp. AN02str]|uniref:hypothetical protein n=1 Tax=Leptolyngbya sp. AN02str TaxID=3423363 RepID=UPI003D3180D6
MTNQPSTDERLERIAELLEATAQQLAALSEQITMHIRQAEQRSAALDAKLDRIATTLEQQNRSLEGHMRLAEQQAQTVATLTNLVSQLLSARA